MPTRVRVLLAEDHETVREGLKLILQSNDDMEIIGEAADGTTAIELAKKLSPDVVLMDVSMPRMNGLKATKLLRECCPETKVLALTRHTDAAYLQEMLRAGASGYVLKQSASAELIRAIRDVATGKKYLDTSLSGQVLDAYTGRALSKVATNISEREAEVLKLIALGYSNKEIAARLRLSVKTIEAHKSNAMKKLDLAGRIDIVRYAVLQGWLGDT